MKKLEEIQSRKLMTSYGGVGSIIETKDNGSLLIDDFDRWPCFSDNQIRNARAVNAPRLLEYINKYHSQHIQNLLAIPTPDLKEVIYYARVNDIRETINSSYFPSWFYCPHCRRLHKYADWERLWQHIFNNDLSFKKNYPACPYCSTRNQKRFRRQNLEQVRFLLASADNGKLMDIPFDKIWGTSIKNAIILDNAESITDDMFLCTSPNSDGLQSISIRRGSLNGGARKSLAEIESKYVVYQNGPNKGAYRLVLRNQNNIYYPTTISCIYIPLEYTEIVRKVNIAHSQGYNAQEIFRNLKMFDPNFNLTLQDIITIIQESQLDLQTQEFAYITKATNYIHNGANTKDRDFWAKRYKHLKSTFISRIYAISRLKETSTIPSYTRIGTPGQQIKWMNTTNLEEESINPKSVDTFSRNAIDFLPVVEAYGEGLFFEINVEQIDEQDKDTFVHSLSHMIMKELEFQCGYSLSSLKEKIYNVDGKYGILIYTIGGADGSYGGLVSLLPSNFDCIHNQESPVKLVSLIENAMERVEDCPNDPICLKEKGHCFACLDIPEISCQMWNQGLDRNVILKYKHALNKQQAKTVVPETDSSLTVISSDNNSSKDSSAISQFDQRTHTKGAVTKGQKKRIILDD